MRVRGFDRSTLTFINHLALRAMLAAALLAGLPQAARAVVSSNAGSSILNGVNINQLVGAEQFYVNGYWGSRAVIANVEAGHVWNGHATLGQVTDFINHSSIDGTTRQYDRHATLVGFAMVGRSDLSAMTSGAMHVDPPESYWSTGTSTTGKAFKGSAFTGLAPMATLWSGAIATNWNADGSFGTTQTTVAYAYRTTMDAGAYQPGRKADVVNSSYGYADPSGIDSKTQVVDALAYANGTTVVIAGGNRTPTIQTISGPASGYNSLTVAAVESDTSAPVYDAPASFSIAGPNSFYNPKTFQTVANARATVDIAAPGANLTLAYYGGTTGANTGGTDTTGGSPIYFGFNNNGTSFASAVVAGGAALLVDLGRDRYAGNAAAIDGRVVKAVLMNSAAKNAGWNNGQASLGGVVTTTQSLDYAVGAGKLDLARAYRQYTTGTADAAGLGGGSVATTGWDYGSVAADSPNTYFLAPVEANSRMAVTLDWFVNRSFNPTLSTASDVQMANLDLEVWSVAGGALSQKVAESVSLYNNAEHLYFDLSAGQDYALRVVWAGETYDMPGTTPNVEAYGLAWDVSPVPEPSCEVLLLLAAAGLAVVRMRRAKFS